MPSIPFFGSDGGTALYSRANVVHDIANGLNSPSSIHPAFALTLERSTSNLGNAMSVNASTILAWQQRHTIQVLATATSSVSITAAICALYWFCMMRRNFRRDLVLLLIMGDFWKSLWYLIYAAVTFRQGQIMTESRFCQASGYLLQMGLEMCDVAIFFMSLHMYLQIFPPSHSFLGHDGLYRARHWVVAAWIVIPNISASLAFLNDGPAYEAAGAFCQLPIRPYWYRLALSWVPRYLNWIFVMGVAIRIYSHVGKEFRVFGAERDRSSSMSMPGESSVDRANLETLASIRCKSVAIGNADLEKQAMDEEVAPDDISVRRTRSFGLSKHSPPDSVADSTKSLPYAVSSRRPSAPDWSGTFGFPTDPLTGPRSAKSNPASRRGSRQIAAGVAAEDFAPPSNYDASRHRGSINTLASLRSSNAPSFDAGPGLEPIREDKRASASTGSSTPHDAGAQLSKNRRRAIQRQLRLLFIYPVVYMLLWAIPFVNHALNYSDYYAQHPIYVLSALNTFCQCFLGFADVSVFCWREKPWSHVAGSDGTFVGSFCFWRLCWGGKWGRREGRTPSHFSDQVEESEKDRSESQAGLIASLKRWSVSFRGSPRPSQASMAAPATPPRLVAHMRTHSGGSDRKQLEVERAHERLAMERAEFDKNRKTYQERRTSVISMQHAPAQQSSPERKEWWDRHLSEDLFHEKDQEGNAHET